MLILLYIFIVSLHIVNGKFHPKIVGGVYEQIEDSPHAAEVKVKCLKAHDETYWGCGSSILNQRLLLTAAHCTDGCDPESVMTVSVGDSMKVGPNIYNIYGYLNHPKYDKRKSKYDIGLLKLEKSVTFSSTVQRVQLLKNPPHNKKAKIAGWGYVDEDQQIAGDQLKVVDQYVLSQVACNAEIHREVLGTLCAKSKNKNYYPSIGDSGSALVVEGFIQIGIVAFKKPGSAIVFYTDTGYFYEWIIKSAEILYCAKH